MGLRFQRCLYLLQLAATATATARCEDAGSLLQLLPDASGVLRDSALLEHPLENFTETNTSTPDELDETGAQSNGTWVSHLTRTWLDWVTAGVRAQEAISEPSTFEAISEPSTFASIQLAMQEHLPTDLKWMTVTLGSLIAIALAWAAWQTIFFHEDGKDAKGGVEGMSEIQLMFNIVKSVVGEGMLSLPAGIAGGTGLLAGSLMTVFFAALMGYTFSLMGRVCHVTGERSHKDCCAKVADPWLAQSMAVVLFVKTIFTCLAFAIVISESFARILRFCGVQGIMATSQAALLLMTFFVLIPLCMQKQLRILSYTSMIGCLGQVWVVFTMQIRYMDGSYIPGGQFYSTLRTQDQPNFTAGVIYWKTTVASFVLLGSLSTAFIAHYNAPKFYSQLQDASPEKFRKVVIGAFSFAMVIYLWIMAVGYLTFGTAAEGLILNNYSEKDMLMTTARFAISFAVVFAFPLGFTGLRDSMMSTFELGQEHFRSVTFGLLSVIICGACSFHDLGLANSLGGAVLGAMITLIFPAVLLFYAGRQSDSDSSEFGNFESTWAAAAVALAGVVLLVFGSIIVLMKKFFPEALHLPQ